MNNEIDRKCVKNDCNGDCTAVTYQDINVWVPITIKASSEVGHVEVECLGKPTINSRCNVCQCKPNNSCKLTISQKLRVTVPVVFGAKAEIGETALECESKKDNNNCYSNKINANN